MSFRLAVSSGPATEPVTLAEAKKHLRIDSTSFADDITSEQTIFPGDHVVAATYSLVGTGIDVLGYDALVLLESGTNGTGGTVDVKIQESDDNSTYTDWSGGAFTQVTTANDNATYEIEYTGTKQYIRAVSTVANATCDFGVSVIKDAPTSAEDDYITNLIKVAREHVERVLSRALITQTLKYYLDDFPDDDWIKLPRPPLQSSTSYSVKYIDTDGTTNTFDTTSYSLDTVSQPGRIVLSYGETWPSTTLATKNPVVITYNAGYGAATTAIPEPIRQAILIVVADLYEHREETVVGLTLQKQKWIERLLWNYRTWNYSWNRQK